MPRPGSMAHEKSKDFKGSMIRLLKNLNPWKYIMIIALILAIVSSILALIAPNKLSDFADIIGEGLAPNTEKLIDISDKIKENFSMENIQEKVKTLFLDVQLDDDTRKQVNAIFGQMKTTKEPEKTVKATIVVERGNSASMVCEKLEQAGIVKDGSDFRKYLISRDLTDFINVGTYELSSDMSYKELAKKITGR